MGRAISSPQGLRQDFAWGVFRWVGRGRWAMTDRMRA